MSKHTPTPWRHEPAGKRLRVVGPRGVWLATAEYAPDHDVEPGDVDRAQAEANAALIVRAVNAHDDMLAALKQIAEGWTLDVLDMQRIALAAIAKAEGRAS